MSTDALSHTELEILEEVATGATNREIARNRGISEATVKKHLTNINAKLETTNRTEAVRVALERGIIQLDTPGTDGASAEAARRLGEELTRARGRARLLRRIAVITALLLAAVLLAWLLVEANEEPVQAPTPAPDISRSRWRIRTSLPAPQAHFALVHGPEGLYAAGGVRADGVTDALLHFSQDRRFEWSELAPMPTAVSHVHGVFVSGQLLVPGGCDADGQPTDAIQAYDPTTDSWVAFDPPLPAPRCDYALAMAQGAVFVFGGRDGPESDSAQDTVWRLDPGGEEWAVEPEMPLPRYGLSAAPLDDAVHVVGGYDRSGEPTQDHWVFDPNPRAADRWSSGDAPALSAPRAGLAAVTLLNRLFVVGGGAEPTDPTVWEAGTEWRYDPTVLPVPEIAARRPERGMGLTIEQNRYVVLAGGESSDGQLLDVHGFYEPFTNRIFVPGGS